MFYDNYLLVAISVTYDFGTTLVDQLTCAGIPCLFSFADTKVT
jgi:hypothetical protein